MSGYSGSRVHTDHTSRNRPVENTDSVDILYVCHAILCTHM